LIRQLFELIKCLSGLGYVFILKINFAQIIIYRDWYAAGILQCKLKIRYGFNLLRYFRRLLIAHPQFIMNNWVFGTRFDGLQKEGHRLLIAFDTIVTLSVGQRFSALCP